jgi:hypothetical protein
MPLLDPLIVTACLSVSANYTQACNKAIQAASQQSGLSSNDSKTELYLIDKGRSLAGDDISNATVAAAYTFKSIHNRNVNAKVPNLGICDSIRLNIKTTEYTMYTTTYGLTLNWKF